MELVKPTPSPPVQRLLAALYAALLAWVNLYIARDFFSAHTAHMNSMQGFWTALAKLGPGAWFHPSWWPYWDCGIPLEAAYSPLYPMLSAVWSAAVRVPPDMAIAAVAGLAYIAAPLTLFALAFAFTRAAGPSFFAGMIYSLISPTQWIVPDGDFHWYRIWEARRLFLVSVWDDAPHMLALALLPLAVLFLARALHRGRRLDYALAILCIALMAICSAFGPVMAAMAGAALVAATPVISPLHSAASWKRRAAAIAATGAVGYLLAIGFLPPSVLRAISESTAAGDQERWTLESLTAFAAAVLGFTILRWLLRRCKAGEFVAFVACFTWIAGSVPLAAAYLHRRLMPQPARYKFEFELGLALLLAFGGRALLSRFPVAIRRACIFLLLSLAAEQIARYRKLEKEYLFPQDVRQTVEYRAAAWTASHLPGFRVFFPGSLAQWANAFTDIPQFTGGSFSMATNQSQQNAEAAIVFETGDLDAQAQLSLAWLRAYGVGAVAVPAAGSPDYRHPFNEPSKFNALPELWSEPALTLRRVPPLASTSLANALPSSAIPRHPPRTPEDAAEAARYAAALRPVSITWQSPGRILINAALHPGDALAIQEGYSPGWRATVAGRNTPIHKDGLGLMWLQPDCAGACEIALDYWGGWEWWLCHALSAMTLIALLLWTFGVPGNAGSASRQT